MAAKPKAGSAEAKKAFYTKQRTDAVKSGDTATTSKIYGKLMAAQSGKLYSSKTKAAATPEKDTMASQYDKIYPAKKAKKSSLGGHRGS